MTQTADTRDQIIDEITRIVAAELDAPAAEFTPETDLRRRQGADSVKVLRIVARIEQRYDIELPDEEVFSVSTISQVTTVVEKALAAEVGR
ncbi:acyl carrier protein [Streptomyces monticola]|uniref:Acyl carrier protein n=1 Tax=Streptomyces monticola TaxID=2666263 RepID=A0ABW2JFE5_9ACTN